MVSLKLVYQLCVVYFLYFSAFLLIKNASMKGKILTYQWAHPKFKNKSHNIDSRASSWHDIVQHHLRLKGTIMNASGKRIKKSKSVKEKRMDYKSCEPCIIVYLPNNVLDKVGVKATDPHIPTIPMPTCLPDKWENFVSWLIPFRINVYYVYYVYFFMFKYLTS